LIPRTLEVLKSLDLFDEIFNHGRHVHEWGRWQCDAKAPEEGLKRQYVIPMALGKGRYAPQIVTIHQGRIGRIFEEDLRRYSARGVERGSRLVNVRLDEKGDATFPVLATVEREGKERTVRTKYLVGADGAHSIVRRSLGISMEGQTTEDIWGVVDIVADTDFPEIGRGCHLNADGDTILLIPRERNLSGQYLTRLYVPFNNKDLPTDTNKTSTGAETSNEKRLEIEKQQREWKSKVNPDSILRRISEMTKPYHIRPKAGTEVEWWAAYQVGQRVAQRIVEKDSSGDARIFLIGDCTCSPFIGLLSC
jgi:phenol 2-monooxygenase